MKVRMQTLLDVLRVAADQYDADAHFHEKGPEGGGSMPAADRRTCVAQMEAKAAECRSLASAVVRGETLVVEV